MLRVSGLEDAQTPWNCCMCECMHLRHESRDSQKSGVGIRCLPRSVSLIFANIKETGSDRRSIGCLPALRKGGEYLSSLRADLPISACQPITKSDMLEQGLLTIETSVQGATVPLSRIKERQRPRPSGGDILVPGQVRSPKSSTVEWS